MKLGDKVTRREQVIVLPRGTILLDEQGDAYKVGIVTPQYLLRFAPLTIIYLPGQLPRSESEIAAEALRAAASAWQMNKWADDLPKGTSRPALILGMVQRAIDFLRERADHIEQGGSHG